MRRLPRLLLNAATAVSVLILLVAAAAVAGSDSPGDQPWEYVRGKYSEPRLMLTLANTQVQVEQYEPVGPFLPRPVGGQGGVLPPDLTLDWNLAGFKFDNYDCLMEASSAPGAPLYRYSGYRLVLPMWFILASAAALPASRLALRVRNFRRRQRPGLCPECGYDLRATPTRCPECGEPAGATTGPPAPQ